MAFKYWQKSNRTWRWSAELKAFALALTQSESDAEDLVQDVLLRIHNGVKLPSESQEAKYFAFRILRNLHIDSLRKSKVRVEYAAEQERFHSESESSSFDLVEQLIVREAFTKLKPEHKEILFLIDVMGLKYVEAAEVIDVAEGTIMSRISRARTAMITQLDGSKVQSIKKCRKKRI